jgi:hypothetical protein
MLPTATFLHIPKCGGIWVKQALRAAGVPLRVVPPDNQHAVAATEGRFVFTFVRHPLTWYPSFWGYRWGMAEQQGGSLDERLREAAARGDEAIDACLVDQSGSPRPFAEFLACCLAGHRGFLSRKYGLYTGRAHFVGRQESLCADLLEALRLARAVFDAEAIQTTPRVNEANPKYRAVVPPSLVDDLLDAEADAVRAHYAADPTPPALPP